MNWPRWFYRFDFPSGKIFKSAEEVPAGCVESPAEVRVSPPPALPEPMPELDEKPEDEPTPKKHKRKTGRPRKVIK